MLLQGVPDNLNEKRWSSFTMIQKIPDSEGENLRSLLEVKLKMQRTLTMQT